MHERVELVPLHSRLLGPGACFWLGPRRRLHGHVPRREQSLKAWPACQRGAAWLAAGGLHSDVGSTPQSHVALHGCAWQTTPCGAPAAGGAVIERVVRARKLNQTTAVLPGALRNSVGFQ
jgi:hypothetical protein